MRKRIFFIMIMSFVLAQAALAQKSDYYLERVAIHAQLMESTLQATEQGSQFQGDLVRLTADVEKWKSTFLEEADIRSVREQLDDHGQMLRASALTASLDAEQQTSLELLLLELEQASQNLTPDHLANEAIRIRFDLPSNDGDRVVPPNQLGAWGANAWGGWGGACGPIVDPWGPYFGRPFYPNSGAYWW